MSHIIILSQWEESLEQLDNYSEQIASGTWDKDQQAIADSLTANVTSLMNDINTSYRTQLDNQIATLESFLGI